MIKLRREFSRAWWAESYWKFLRPPIKI